MAVHARKGHHHGAMTMERGGGHHHLPHDLREGDAALLPSRERPHLLQRLGAAHPHLPEVLADLERRRRRRQLEERVERALAQVELVHVVLREAAHPQPPRALHLARRWLELAQHDLTRDGWRGQGGWESVGGLLLHPERLGRRGRGQAGRVGGSITLSSVDLPMPLGPTRATRLSMSRPSSTPRKSSWRPGAGHGMEWG